MFVLSLHSFVLDSQSVALEGFPDLFVELLDSICVDSDWDLLFWQHQDHIEFAFVRFALIDPPKVAAQLALLRLQPVGRPWLRAVRVERLERAGIFGDEWVKGAFDVAC